MGRLELRGQGQGAAVLCCAQVSRLMVETLLANSIALGMLQALRACFPLRAGKPLVRVQLCRLPRCDHCSPRGLIAPGMVVPWSLIVSIGSHLFCARRGLAWLSGSWLSSLGSLGHWKHVLESESGLSLEFLSAAVLAHVRLILLHCMRCVDAGAPVLLRPRSGMW